MLNTVQLYHPPRSGCAASWKQLAGMAGRRCMHGCVALNGKIYVVGGLEGGSYTDSAEVYDPQTDGWQPLAKMSTARYGFGLAAVGGKIYAIGGFDGRVALQSIEAYNPQLGTWTLVASMSATRIYHATVVLDGKIYAMGGEGADRNGPLNTMEVYDPQAGSHQLVAGMPQVPQGLYGHAATAMSGKIYVTGGGNQEDTFNAVYVYDPQTDAWTQLASMNVARRVHAAAEVGGKLYVFGGNGSDGARLRTSEVYDPTHSDSWAQLGRGLTSTRTAMVAVAL
eukprot:scaffold8219_cov58-Phaeocystis_antarctica.AAC.2